MHNLDILFLRRLIASNTFDNDHLSLISFRPTVLYIQYIVLILYYTMWYRSRIQTNLFVIACMSFSINPPSFLCEFVHFLYTMPGLYHRYCNTFMHTPYMTCVCFCFSPYSTSNLDDSIGFEQMTI